MNPGVTRAASRLRNPEAKVSDLDAPTTFVGSIECIREFTP
jgi:hypothetical protein